MCTVLLLLLPTLRTHKFFVVFLYKEGSILKQSNHHVCLAGGVAAINCTCKT